MHGCRRTRIPSFNTVTESAISEKRPLLLLLASKLGYQTRSFAEAAQRLGIGVIIGSDRCHQLEDPWADGAIALRFDQPEESARLIVQQSLVRPVNGLIALGDRATSTAAYAARSRVTTAA